VKANSETMVRMMDVISNRNTLASKSRRFVNNITIEPNRIREIIYSLIFLNRVNPIPSTKQIGKMFQ